MRVGLVDCDSHNFPNLPLMKISSYHKQLGNIVEFADVGTYYDVLYVSKIFTESKEPDLPDYGVMFWGGSGYDLENQLPEEIEHCYPDYSLYPQLTKDTADLMEIDPDMVEQNLYGQFASHLNDIMNLEQKEHPSAREFATAKYAEVDKPYQLYSGLSRDAFDYIELYIFILSILCIAMVVPTFANEYQTGSDSIMRCTKNGRVKFSVIRILAAGVIFTVVFIVGMVIHLFIINLAFGAECLKTSFQMLFSIINLANLNLGQLQVILVLAGLLSLLASISCTLFLSAKCRDSLSSLLISLVVMLLPTIIYTALGGSVWLSTILPSAGIGLQNNFLYQLYGFNFLYVGDMSFWTPYIILISAAIEIPVFILLTIRSYYKHQVA